MKHKHLIAEVKSAIRKADGIRGYPRSAVAGLRDALYELEGVTPSNVWYDVRDEGIACGDCPKSLPQREADHDSVRGTIWISWIECLVKKPNHCPVVKQYFGDNDG